MPVTLVTLVYMSCAMLSQLVLSTGSLGWGRCVRMGWVYVHWVQDVGRGCGVSSPRNRSMGNRIQQAEMDYGSYEGR